MTGEDATVQELEFIRDYSVTVARLWRAVTAPDQVVQWFGTEGVTIRNCDMNLSSKGSWVCEMVGKDSGQNFKISGYVTHVRAPDGNEGSVGFTWAWHDNEDSRGPESHVIFEVSSHEKGARLRVVHRDLPDTETAQNHSRGWLSTLGRLDAFISHL